MDLKDLFRGSGPFLRSLDVPPEAEPVLLRLLEEIKTANQRTNLVSFQSDEELFQRHLVDSLSALTDPAARRASSARAVDVGSGGGFPGLLLAAARPGWTVALVDAVRKKQSALTDVVARAGLANAEPLWARAEDLARDPAHRERYDLAFCRAVGRFSTVLELTLPLLKTGGALLAHRGEEAPEEVRAAAEALALLGGGDPDMREYAFPGLEKKRYIVRVEKRRPTPPTYPRRPGMPAKRPL